MKACLKLQPDVLFQRIPANFKIESTEWEIYIKLYKCIFTIIMIHTNLYQKNIYTTVIDGKEVACQHPIAQKSDLF